MKKTYILILGAILSLTSCGMIALSTSSDDDARFQDGIYCNSPTFLTKEERSKEKAKTDSLIAITKESPIYLFGDKKDTILIPENFMATIQYDQKVGGTVVTVGENPYSWRWDLENNYGYYYNPYSLGYSWYWNRYYSPYYSSFYGPYYNSYYGPYYGSYWNYWSYDPWYYGGYYDPWYYGGYWGGYYGNYWGWHDPWHHYHHHCGWYNPPHHHHGGPSHIAGGATGGHSDRYNGLRAHTESFGSVSTSHSTASKPSVTTRPSTGTSRGGMSVGNRTSRTSSSARQSTSVPSYRRPENSSSNNASSSVSSSSPSYNRESSSSSYTRGETPSHSYNRNSPSNNSYNHGSSSPSGSYSRGYSAPSGGSSYSRGGSSGGYRR